MLVHICCSVDSHYFLQRLRKDYPNERIVGYFYDPNIHPYSEFLLRFEDVKRSCEKLGIKLICGEYDYEAWLGGTKGLEDEPEKGKRCEYCFDFRMKDSAKKATELGLNKITTTLLMSPKKDFTQLKKALDEAVTGLNLEAVAVDYRKNGGTSEQFILAKKDKLYHQNYCGCVFALKKQRDSQNLPQSELMSELHARALYGSIEARLELYKKVRLCEARGEKFHLFRRRFLNYRLLRASVKFDGVVVPSYFVLYSGFKRESLKLNVECDCEIDDELKEGTIFMSIERFNKFTNSKFKSVDELCKRPLELGAEMKFRREISGEFSQNPIIILDEVKKGSYEIYAKAVFYNDSEEILVLES
ncbi:epoxyqueuosine reductase QueH [Campylobacter concisus]|uniref:epoxyqueuosine reductase QueH n=1 Tax=Campylobacter concisus TaxID=199 RepID=UPI0011E79531|nr:epoxyqueuosine reductase QueH [Campylobacter concisus]